MIKILKGIHYKQLTHRNVRKESSLSHANSKVWLAEVSDITLITQPDQKLIKNKVAEDLKNTVNPFNFDALKFCVFKSLKFHCFKNLLFSCCTHLL